MRSVLATAVVLVALSAPSFAETTGTDARGADHGSFRLSQKDPNTVERSFAMARDVKVLKRSHIRRYDRRG